jgi:hypothetical protein
VYRHAAALVCVICLLPTAPLYAAALEDEESLSFDGPLPPRLAHLPEPMVFDLVRGLNARAGELEANALARIPVSGQRPDTVLWAPEVEYALFDGFALELELPMLNSTLEAVKVAAQATFGSTFEGRLLHGGQAIVEHALHVPVTYATALYLVGLDLESGWSFFGMLGLRGTFARGGEDVDLMETIANLHIGKQLSPRLNLGVEVHSADVVGGFGEVLLMPQAHIRLAGHTALQAGIGARYAQQGYQGVAAMRLIFEL